MSARVASFDRCQTKSCIPRTKSILIFSYSIHLRIHHHIHLRIHIRNPISYLYAGAPSLSFSAFFSQNSTFPFFLFWVSIVLPWLAPSNPCGSSCISRYMTFPANTKCIILGPITGDNSCMWISRRVRWEGRSRIFYNLLERDSF